RHRPRRPGRRRRADAGRSRGALDRPAQPDDAGQAAVPRARPRRPARHRRPRPRPAVASALRDADLLVLRTRRGGRVRRDRRRDRAAGRGQGRSHRCRPDAAHRPCPGAAGPGARHRGHRGHRPRTRPRAPRRADRLVALLRADRPRRGSCPRRPPARRRRPGGRAADLAAGPQARHARRAPTRPGRRERGSRCARAHAGRAVVYRPRGPAARARTGRDVVGRPGLPVRAPDDPAGPGRGRRGARFLRQPRRRRAAQPPGGRLMWSPARLSGRKIIGAGAACALLAIAGCTSGQAADQSASTGTTLNTAYYADPSGGIDPDVFYDVEGDSMMLAMYNTLLTYKPGTSTLAPSLATSWRESADGLTYTFNLRHGVRFHDGTPFNSRAVEVNFQRRMILKQAVSYMVAGVASMQTPSPYKFVVHLKKRNNAFLDYMASMYGPKIVSPLALREHAGTDHAQKWLSTHEDGTGPYRLTVYHPGSQYVLTRSNGYWGQRPYFKRVVISVI